MAKAWSYSALNQFETCPKQYYEEKIAKSVPFRESEAMADGKADHKALELRVVRNKPLPLGRRHLERFAKLVEKLPGSTTHGELKAALNANYEPCDWFADDVWVRVIIDVIKTGDDSAFILDWKTGKRKPDLDQLALMAAVVFSQLPEMQRITAALVWTKSAKLDKKVYKREELPALWNRFLPRVERFQHAFKTTTYPAKPSGLCRRHCPVESCPHHGT